MSPGACSFCAEESNASVKMPPHCPHLELEQILSYTHPSIMEGERGTLSPYLPTHTPPSPHPHPGRRLAATQAHLGERWHGNKSKQDQPDLWLSGSCNFWPSEPEKKVGVVQRKETTLSVADLRQPDR